MTRNEKAKLHTRKPTARSAKAPADQHLFWVMLGLAAVGVVAVYSAISFFAEVQMGQAPEAFLARHLIRVMGALVALVAVSFFDYHRLEKLSLWALAGSIVLLVIVQISGQIYGGAERWLDLGFISFQPSDFARVALIAHVAVLLAKKQTYIEDFKRGFLPLLFWIAATCLLIGVDDLSSAAVLLLTCLLMCFIGRVSLWHLSGVGLAGVVLAALFLALNPARADRIEAYVGMDIFPPYTERVEDVQGEDYQAHQAKIAFALGGVTGVGPGKSTQRDFLPAPYNDFIFAIIGEEYGLIGALLLLGLFTTLLFRGFLRIARQARDDLGLFLAAGLTASLALYGFINAGVACGLLPVTGLPMPLVSYGGTSLLATGIMGGLLLNISRHVRTD